VNAPNCDAATATAAAQSVADALELISDNAKLLALRSRSAESRSGESTGERPA